MKKHKQFGLTEFLIVLTAIVILSLIAVVSISYLRAKSRDVNRLSHMNALATAMSNIYNQTESYLDCGCGNNSHVHMCAGSNLMSEQLPVVSNFKDPVYYNEIKPCFQQCSGSGCDYSFGEITKDTYEIYFYLERGVDEYEAGCYKLTEKGIINNQ